MIGNLQWLQVKSFVIHWARPCFIDFNNFNHYVNDVKEAGSIYAAQWIMMQKAEGKIM